MLCEEVRGEVGAFDTTFERIIGMRIVTNALERTPPPVWTPLTETKYPALAGRGIGGTGDGLTPMPRGGCPSLEVPGYCVMGPRMSTSSVTVPPAVEDKVTLAGGKSRGTVADK